MSDVHWRCPHCGSDLTIDAAYADKQTDCPSCGEESCPAAEIRATMIAVIGSLDRRDQRAFRQQVREFRAAIRDAFEPELKELLSGLSNLEIATAGTEASEVGMVLCNAVEEELEARVHETTWSKAGRLAKRGARSTKAWLKTDEGKAVTKGAAIVAAFFGINLLG